MITDLGQKQKLKLLAGTASRFADVFVVGISDATLTTAATSLDFAWATANITGTYIDNDLNQVVFYGTLSPELAGDVKELGLVSLSDDFVKTGLPNSLVYSFTVNEQWFSDEAFTITNNSSVGSENYKFDDSVTGQYLAKGLDGINMSRYDTIKLKLLSSEVTQIELRLSNDDANYAWKDINLTNGVNFSTHTLASFTKEGNFNPQSVNEIRYIINTVSNATNSLEFDAMTISSEENGGLVARHVLAVAQYKRTGAGMEIEFAVALDV